MNKKEIERLYNELGDTKIDDLYFYSCLLLSGFNKDKAYELIDKLRDLYIKDENNYSIGKLSDMFYYVYNHYNIDGTPIRKLLHLMYIHEYDSCEEDDDLCF